MRVQDLNRLLDLDHSPVAVTFHEQEPSDRSHSRPASEPGRLLLLGEG